MIKKIIGKAVTTFAGREDFEVPKHDSPLFDGLDWERLPRHVAVIMDGNGRWGKEQGVMRTAGHSAGVKTLKNILKTAVGLELDALTVYAFSTENWKRPESEVNFLMQLFYDSLKKELQEMHDNDVRIRFMGRLDKLPKALQAEMHEAEELMKNNTGVKFNVAVNYGGQDELVRAMQSIAADVQAGKITPEAVNDALVEERLDTVGNLPVDLVIRTSGEQDPRHHLNAHQ